LRVFLRTVSGKNAGTRIGIPGHRFLIGRADDCHLRAHSDQVSTHHCEILVQPNGPTLLDLGSRNGTFVDGQRISAPHLLREGALIQVGPLQLLVEIFQSNGRSTKDTDRPGSASNPSNPDSSEATVLETTLPAANLPAGALAAPAASLAPVGARRRLASLGQQFPVQVILHVANGRNAGAKVPVQRHRFVIGRAKDCHLCAHSEEVSGHHCEILVQPNGVLVLDLGSRNGTFVDGRPIEGPCALYDGARLRVGSLELLVEVSEAKWRRASEAVRGFSSQAAMSETASSTATSLSPSEQVAPEGKASLLNPEGDPPSERFDVLEFLSEPPSEPATKPPPIDILAEIQQSAAEQAETVSPEKAPATKETKQAAADGLKRLFTPRQPS
jgi:pSer/pThr/pTyr-binding forkhead associated (FHA) protein